MRTRSEARSSVAHAGVLLEWSASAVEDSARERRIRWLTRYARAFKRYAASELEELELLDAAEREIVP